MEKYIAKEKILTVSDSQTTGKLTPMGEDIVLVEFENGEKEYMPAKRLDTISTNSPIDETARHELLKKKVSEILYSIMIEYGIKMGEVNSITDGMTDLINNGFQSASKVMFGVDYAGIPLTKINEILIEDATKK